MLTNKIHVTYNMEQIDKDFDIYKVEKANKDYYKHNILDSAAYDFHAAAVCWPSGANALVLFHKGEVTERDFKESIMNEYQDVKVQKIDVLDSEQCEKVFYYENRLLAQLLINSIWAPKHEAFRYNNLTGKLLYHDPSWIRKEKLTKQIKYIRFLDITIDPGMYLNLDHKTFKRCSQSEPGSYVIDPKTGEFRKKLKTDKDLATYKEGSVSNHHFRVDYVNISDYAPFKKSKMGVMEQFLRDVKENLSQYLSIEFAERKETMEFDIPELEKKGISTKEYGEMLKKRGVVIVDENRTEASERTVEQLKNQLKKDYGIEAMEGRLSKEAYNIRVIHDAEYYEKNGWNDPHNDPLKGYIVQHLIEETLEVSEEKESSLVIKKIVQELIVKGDVRDGFISIYDWKRLGSEKEWTFVLREKMKTDLKYYNYYRLKITHDGELKFDSFYDRDQEETEEWGKICYAYETADKQHWGVKNKVEGLVYSDIDNIQVILLTREGTLPDIGTFKDVLKETDKNGKVSKEILLHAMKEFEYIDPKYAEEVFNWQEKLEKEEKTITKSSLKKILNMRKGIASKFNRFLHEKYDIWIDGELRKEEFDAMFQISNLLNIKYEYDVNDFKDGKAFFYCVGAKSKKCVYSNACRIRKVISFGDSIEFEELLPLMTVSFVRNDQYTVLPFPYKYLREYMAQ